MNAKSLRRACAVALASAMTLLGLFVPGAPAHAAAPGSITGVLTRNGVPVGMAWVTAQGDDGYGTDYTKGDGSFRITDLAAGAYQLSFNAPDHFEQWSHGKTSAATADPITVKAGANTVVNEALLPGATITGKLVDADGNGVQTGISLVTGTDEWDGVASAYTYDGSFSLTVLPGTYKLRFDDGVQEQWAHNARTFATATPIVVGSIGETITVDETRLPTGRLAGRFTEGGAGVAGVDVQLDSASSDYLATTTDANGYYAFEHVFGGAYKVSFAKWDDEDPTQRFQQWAYGKVSLQTAESVTVVPGSTTTVNDSRLPTGSVKITAKDARTGAVINDFWAYGGVRSGDTTNGAVILENVAIGSYQMVIGGAGYKILENVPLTVTEGVQTILTVQLVPYSKIKTKVVDAKTGAPVQGVCVFDTQPGFARTPDGCGDPERYSNAAGEVTVNLESPGSYQLFALPRQAPGYGAQWVGVNGGTGDQQSARLTTVADGATVTVPPIKLDKAGVITGKVTSQTGQRIRFGAVGLFPEYFNVGGNIADAELDSNGNYRIDFLGPYQWPLMFRGADHATQWSGTTGNRLVASKIKVTSGKTTTYNYQLRTGRAVVFTVTDRNAGGFVVLHDAVSGDYVSAGWADNGSPTMTMHVLSGEPIKVAWLGGAGWEWFGGTNFASAWSFVLARPAYQISLDHPVRPPTQRRESGPVGPYPPVRGSRADSSACKPSPGGCRTRGARPAIVGQAPDQCSLKAS
ncbi:hypothetical protein F4553_004530 [Allocatelliglobosispora scoriae]|uniref:alpha-amylase n=1 Tax=Allocatelliglobosispora scoriae TaxID=643052 RepID=A0A841BWQ6_9ACTN|nr:SdrD B-like domain-containing protein [Allocatelliglobosispora scoriae]MBB5871151.1 hypothetical protein [Allocatelliglobosispora scoriae]